MPIKKETLLTRPEYAAMMRVISEAADRGEPTPSNSELAERTGLAMKSTAFRSRLAALAQCGLVRVEPNGNDHGCRRIHVLATGRHTDWTPPMQRQTRSQKARYNGGEPRICMACRRTFHDPDPPSIRRRCDTCRTHASYRALPASMIA